jgi:aminoglycoside phosphotransferase family enzyme/predicted kinase
MLNHDRANQGECHGGPLLDGALAGQAALFNDVAAAFRRQGHEVQTFETHISWVLVAAGFAYKFKKAVRYDFVDFSTPDARRFYCQEELRLNRRLAPQLYLDVVPFADRCGNLIEHAVKMRAFDQQALWTYRLGHDLVTPGEIDQLAASLAAFHASSPAAGADTPWGTPDMVHSVAADNVAELEGLLRDRDSRMLLDGLKDWELLQHPRLHATLGARKANRAIRECHGDLHSGNVLTIDGQVAVFDCIEFSDALRLIDVIADMAFIYMDLRHHGRQALAARLLSNYLEHTGDYAGLRVMRYYVVHRALVRCKVALLRARQFADEGQAQALEEQATGYLRLAGEIAESSPAGISGISGISITHGFSGCGKTTVAEQVVERTGAIRLRSDVERKRLHGMSVTDRSGKLAGSALYAPASTARTYARLATLSQDIAQAGWPVIVDAAFLTHGQRCNFASLAKILGIPFVIFDVHASMATMRSRLAARMRAGHDASDAGADILAQQIGRHDPFTAEELTHIIAVDTESGAAGIRNACDAFQQVLRT